MSDIVSRNLLVYPYYRLNSTDNGVSMVVNNDGSITLNGTASSNVESQNKFYDLNSDSKLELPVGEYIFSIDGLPVIDMYSQFLVREVVAPYTAIIAVNNTAPFTITQEIADKLKTGDYNVQIKLCVRTNRTIDNVTVYPMIRLSSDPDNTWEPYHPPIHVPDVYFRCTSTAGGAKLEVSYGDEFVGKVLTATNGNKTIRRMAGTSGTVTFTVPESGLWTVSGEVDGTTYSVQESVVLDYSVALVSGFDYKSWLTAGGVDPTSYSSLADVLADEILVRRLMTIHAAVDYLASFRTVNAGLETVINNDICAKWINNRDYALDTLHANSAIAAVMDTADKYFYGEWALLPQVPKMTSNNAPSGVASATSEYSSFSAYKAFDSNASSNWLADSKTNSRIAYHFTSAVEIRSISVRTEYNSQYGSGIKNYKVQYSDDDSTWTDVEEDSYVYANQDYIDVRSLPARGRHEYWAIYIEDTYNPNKNISVAVLQFYAWAPKGAVPVMTANNAPYGTLTGDGGTSGHDIFKAFDGDDSTYYQTQAEGHYLRGLTYALANPTCVKRVKIRCLNAMTEVAIRVGNSTSNLTVIKEVASVNANEDVIIDVPNDDYYMYIAIEGYVSSGATQIATLQFYGRSLNVSVPIMTSDTAPFGEAFDGGHYTDHLPWKAFDNQYASNTQANEWQSQNSNITGGERYVGYDFGKSVCVKMAVEMLGQHGSNNGRPRQQKYQGWNGTEWVDLLTITSGLSDLSWLYHNIPNTNGYKKYRAVYSDIQGDSNWSTRVKELQFYGLDYSEKEFEAGTTKKWLYDHGVELEELTVIVGSSGTKYVEKTDSYIELKSGSVSDSFAAVYHKIDMANYSLVRVKIGDVITVNTSYKALLQVYKTTAMTPIVASRAIESSDLPNNAFLDISNINDEELLTVIAESRYNAPFRVTELWVE